ncbi:MAG: hypothetical protein JXA20_01255 [Spirochaetes bacterium]|nr:hypothetical protein [Spirochaetota bacterium]
MKQELAEIQSILAREFGSEGAALLLDDLMIAVRQDSGGVSVKRIDRARGEGSWRAVTVDPSR